MATISTRYLVPEEIRASFSFDGYSGEKRIRSLIQGDFESTSQMFDSFAHSLSNLLQTSTKELQITGILTLMDEHATSFIQSTEVLFEILTSLQSLIDYSSKKHSAVVNNQGIEIPGAEAFQITDTIRSHALTTYTNLLIVFPDITVNIRGQYVKALVDMTTRRNLKKRDYVNSKLRSIACECLNELELSFPGEVGVAYKITDWLSNDTATSPSPPVLVEAVQDESLSCFENYTKLFFTCCRSGKGETKPLTKTISLVLDSLEFASVWQRVHVAIVITQFLIEQDFQDSWTHAVVVHHFSRLLESRDVHQVHAFLSVSLPFISEWDTTFRHTVIDRVYAITVDPHIDCAPVKLLATTWLSCLINNPRLSEIVYSKRFVLVPKKSDPYQLVEAKLTTLLVFASITRRVPRNILRLLDPIESRIPTVPEPRDFSGVVFRFLTRVLILFGDHSQEDPALFGIPDYLNELIRSSLVNRVHAFLPSIACILEIISNMEISKFPINTLLSSFGKFINEIQPPQKTLNYFVLTTYLAMNKSLNPEYVISSTDRLLGSGVNLGWEDGLKVLEIIRQIILHHLPSVATGADDLHARVQSLLRHVVEHVQNVDIRDRANLYMRFVEGLPSDEREKFICPSCSSSELNVVDPNLSVTQEIDSTSQSEEVLSKIIEFAKNFEKRKKLGIMDGNWAVFESGKIGLPFTLRFRHNFPDSDVPSALFGVEISFSICEGFVPFESVRIPYLERPTTCGTAEGFPYSYDINLTLQALCPMPAEFRVEIVFTDINGKFHRGELEPFSVEFEDLFMPCQDWGKNFVQKWNNPFAKLLPLGKDFIDKMICERLNHFLVPPKMKGKGKICEEELAPLEPFDFEHETLLHGTSEPSEPPTTRNVLIFIPPDSYLLMRFVMGDTTCVVWIATDRSDLLLLLDAFFDKWISASPPGTSSKRNDPLHASDERFISS